MAHETSASRHDEDVLRFFSDSDVEQPEPDDESDGRYQPGDILEQAGEGKPSEFLSEPYLIGRFIRFYGVDMWFNPKLWPTTDGIIPHKLFVIFMGLTTNIMVMEQLMDSQATAQGIGIAFTPKEKQPRLKSELKKIEKIAFPSRDA